MASRDREQLSKQDLDEMVKCGICSETFNDPRLLPCCHSFCNKCLKSLGVEIEDGTGKLCCPVCKGKFALPQKGIDGLQKNSFLSTLIEIRSNTVGSKTGEHLCDVCFEKAVASEQTPSAEMYCCECEQKFCPECVEYHRKFKATRNHRLTPIQSDANNVTLPTKVAKTVYCKLHKDHPVDLFCGDCHIAVCPMCYIEKHQQCKGRMKLSDASNEFHERIHQRIQNLSETRAEFQKRRDQLEQQKIAVLDRTTELENIVRTTTKELKELADLCANSLLDMLKSAKETDLTEIATQKQEVDSKFSTLDSYLECSNGVCNDGSDVDFCEMAEWLIKRSTELEKVKTAGDMKQSSILQKVFDNRELEKFLGNEFLFTIKDTCETEEDKPVPLRLHSEPAPDIQHSISMVPLSRQLSVPSKSNNGNFPTNSETLNRIKEDFRKVQVQTEDQDRKIPELAKLQTIKTHMLKTEHRDITGITILANELFVSMTDSSEIEVYSTTTFQLENVFQVSGLIDPGDMVSCARKSCLYIIDWTKRDHSNYILKIRCGGEILKKWVTPNDYSWLSVAQNNSIIILTLHDQNTINEYNPDGNLVNAVKIDPDSGVKNIFHAIKLNSGDFVVCCTYNDDQQRLCKVASNGTVKFSFGTKVGVERMRSPAYLLENWTGSIVVVDQSLRRVRQLTSNFEFEKDLATQSQKLSSPRRICIYEGRNILLVADKDGIVFIFILV